MNVEYKPLRKPSKESIDKYKTRQKERQARRDANGGGGSSQKPTQAALVPSNLSDWFEGLVDLAGMALDCDDTVTPGDAGTAGGAIPMPNAEHGGDDDDDDDESGAPPAHLFVLVSHTNTKDDPELVCVTDSAVLHYDKEHLYAPLSYFRHDEERARAYLANQLDSSAGAPGSPPYRPPPPPPPPPPPLPAAAAQPDATLRLAQLAAAEEASAGAGVTSTPVQPARTTKATPIPLSFVGSASCKGSLTTEKNSKQFAKLLARP